MPSMLNLLFLALSRTRALSCATDVSTSGTKTSLGACGGGGSGLDSGCRKHGNSYQPYEWVGGVYFISDTQAHNSASPLAGQIYICSAMSSGGWGVGQAACCSTNAETPLSATRATQFGPTGGYRTYYDCSACPLPPWPPPPPLLLMVPCGVQVDGECGTVPGNGPHPVTICQSGSYVTGIVDLAQGATAQAQDSSPFSKSYSP